LGKRRNYRNFTFVLGSLKIFNFEGEGGICGADGNPAVWAGV
jgi:hypothetical protein